MISLVHISDDSKFLDFAIGQYDLLKNVSSVYLVVSSLPQLKYVKSSNISIVKNIDDVVDFIKNNDCDFVIVHGLFFSLSKLQLVNKPFIWCSWGFDIYSDCSSYFHKLISLPLYKPLTKKFIVDNTPMSVGQKILKYCKALIARYRYYKFINTKVKYISTVFPEEYQFIQKSVKGVGFYPFRYMNVRNEKIEVKNDIGGECILLGNSCDETNNHMDVLEKLESLQKEIKVIMPISYPENRTLYKKVLLDYSEKLRYVKVIPINNFMPYDEYAALLSQCSYAIFGHVRQQAAGNITQMLKNGAKIFLYKNSIGYLHYKALNYTVFSIEDDLNDYQLSSRLSPSEVDHNRKIFESNRDVKNYMQNLQSFFDGL